MDALSLSRHKGTTFCQTGVRFRPFLSAFVRFCPFPSVFFDRKSAEELKKNNKNPFVLIETMSLMLCLQALAYERVHSQSPQSPHQSFQDFNQNEGKTPLASLTEKPLRTGIDRPQMTQIVQILVRLSLE